MDESEPAMPKWVAIIAMPLAVLVVLYVAVGFAASLLLEKWRFRRR